MAERWLVATIGERDPETEHGPTGPLRAAREVQPTQALLIHTRDAEFRARAMVTAERLETEIPGVSVRFHELRVVDPTWIARLLHEVQGVVVDLAVGAQDEVHACGSSGTPQMGLALTLAVDARFPSARHWQALDPSRARGTPLRPFEPDLLRHQPEVRAGFRALAECRVRDARDRFQARLNGPPEVIGPAQQWLVAGHKAATALARVEDFQVSAATRELRKANLPRAPLDRSAAFSRLVDWYAELSGNRARRTNRSWPMELAALALRERRAERPLLAMIRLALAHEVALQVRLIESHGIDADHLTPAMRARIEAVLGDEPSRKLIPRWRDPAGEVGAWRVEGVRLRFAALCHVEPGLAERMTVEMEEAQERLVQIRNDLVHRGTLEPANGVEEAFDRGVDYLAFLFTHFRWGDPREVPSAPAGVERVASELATLARVDMGG